MSRHQLYAELAELNPVPDPQAHHDPEVQRRRFEQIVATPATPSRSRRRPRRQRVVRIALVSGVTAAASLGLLIARDAPQSLAPIEVAAAVSEQLDQDRGILHVVEHHARLDDRGDQVGPTVSSETWTLLEDFRYSRSRGLSGTRHEFASTPTASYEYDPSTRTFTTVRYPGRSASDPPGALDPVHLRIAREAAAGSLPLRRTVFMEQDAFQIQHGATSIYYTVDEPRLLGIVSRASAEDPLTRRVFSTYEVIPVNDRTRQVFELSPPAGAIEKVRDFEPEGDSG